MNRAYLFGYNVEATPARRSEATLVSLRHPYEPLVEASENDQLRCTYEHCFQPVSPVRERVGSEDLRCFAHRPPKQDEEVPFCPLRVGGDGGSPPGEHFPPEHNARKLVESALRAELEHNLQTTVSGSAYTAHEPHLRLQGRGETLHIRALAPGCEQLWRQPFDGLINGEEVLFFVLSSDAPFLEQPFIDEHLLRCRPALLVEPGKKAGAEHIWYITQRLADGDGKRRPFSEVDLLYVDYQAWLGIDRRAEHLFIPTPYRVAIQTHLTKRLGDAKLRPEMRTMLRLMLKHLLVEGAAIAPALFEGLPRPSATEVALLLQNDELLDLCASDPLLTPLFEAIVSDALTAIDRTIVTLRKEAAGAAEELAAARAKAARLEVALAQARAEIPAAGACEGLAQEVVTL